MNPNPQIIVLDAGGQYCHLEARKVRDLGVYAEVRASETPAANWPARRASSSPAAPAASTTPAAPQSIPAIFAAGVPVLGICYGQQLMAHLLGGEVRKGDKGEYGLATLDLFDDSDPMFAGLAGQQQIWMSHRDVVGRVPEASPWRGSTDTCAVAAIANPAKKLYGVQFHPEVVHTARGLEYLANFVFGVCGCVTDWDPRHRAPLIEQEIRDGAGSRNIFFFVSGGVDSSVAFALCQRALGPDRVRGVYVDTGLMREGETDFVRRMPGISVETRRRAVSGRPGRRHRPRTEAPHHRRGVRARAGAHHRIRATCWTSTGFWARAPSIPTRSNRAARPKPRSSRRTTTAWRGFRS